MVNTMQLRSEHATLFTIHYQGGGDQNMSVKSVKSMEHAKLFTNQFLSRRPNKSGIDKHHCNYAKSTQSCSKNTTESGEETKKSETVNHHCNYAQNTQKCLPRRQGIRRSGMGKHHCNYAQSTQSCLQTVIKWREPKYLELLTTLRGPKDLELLRAWSMQSFVYKPFLRRGPKDLEWLLR